ncbi:unnamed protein product [Ectocarpus sp. 8 AP-2014]
MPFGIAPRGTAGIFCPVCATPRCGGPAGSSREPVHAMTAQEVRAVYRPGVRRLVHGVGFFKAVPGNGIIAAGLFGASFLSGFCNFCTACIIFGMAARSKILPTTVCEECNIQFMVGSQEVGPEYCGE